MNSQDQRNWRDLAEQVTQETDPERLLELVSELNRILEAGDQKSRGEKLGSAAA